MKFVFLLTYCKKKKIKYKKKIQSIDSYQQFSSEFIN